MRAVVRFVQPVVQVVVFDVEALWLSSSPWKGICFADLRLVACHNLRLTEPLGNDEEDGPDMRAGLRLVNELMVCGLWVLLRPHHIL
jgi:hypothetical protein